MEKVKIKGKKREVFFTDDDIKILYEIQNNAIKFIRLINESGVKRI